MIINDGRNISTWINEIFYTILFVAPINKRVRSKYLKCTRCNVIYFASYTIDVSIHQLSITIIKSAVSLINDRWNNIGRQSGSFLNHTITRTLQSSKLKRYGSKYSQFRYNITVHDIKSCKNKKTKKKRKRKNKSAVSRRINLILYHSKNNLLFI